jgi:hypothetical protein
MGVWGASGNEISEVIACADCIGDDGSSIQVTFVGDIPNFQNQGHKGVVMHNHQSWQMVKQTMQLIVCIFVP